MDTLKVGQLIIMDMKVAEEGHHPEAQKLAGKIGHITQDLHNGYYYIDLDRDVEKGHWQWSTDYIHPITNNCEECNEYNICDKVHCLNKRKEVEALNKT